jgi:GT2 family glycosyltransferase
MAVIGASEMKNSFPNPVSAVVVNYNAGDFLRECLQSALEQVAEVIVVDNASEDGSIDNIQSEFSSESRIKIIRNSKNLGFSAACNIGLRHAQAEHILFLNPDCRLSFGAVTRLLRVLQSDPSVGIVGGLLVNPDGSEQAGGRRAIPTPWRSFVAAFGLTRFARRWPQRFEDFNLHRQPLPAGPLEVEAVSGACMLVRRAAIADVGEWDDGYFLHCEDLDWCLRFRRKGWKILFVPDARVDHVHGACSRSRPIFVEWHKHRGMIRFYRKFFREDYPWGLMGLVGVGVWLHFVLVVARYVVRLGFRRVGGERG